MTWNPMDSNLATSSLLATGPDVVAVWAVLIATADRDGISEVTIPFLAGAMRVPDERIEAAFEILCSPDPRSRHTAHEGRRLERVEGGWRLLGHSRYRQRCSRRAAAERQARYRERQQRAPDPEASSDPDLAQAMFDPMTCDRCGEAAATARDGRLLCTGCAAEAKKGEEPCT